jgi:Tfp pilus assembly protein PilP
MMKIDLQRTLLAAASMLCMMQVHAVSLDDEAVERDPFSQPVPGSITYAMATTEIQADVPPLQRFPLSSLQLVGVVESKRGSIGVIRTPDGHDLFAFKGDLIGEEKTRISKVKDFKFLLTIDDQPAYVLGVNKRVVKYVP